MKTILSKFKKIKNKKAAASLIAIVVSVTLVASLSIGVFSFLSNKVRSTAMDEINNTMNTITGIAEANRNNADIVIPGGPGGPGGGEEPEINTPITQEGTIPEGGTYYIGAEYWDIYYLNITNYEYKLEAGDPFPEETQTSDVYIYGDYAYFYNRSIVEEEGIFTLIDESMNGWSFIVNSIGENYEQSSYGDILSSINGKPVVSAAFAFRGCNKMVSAPVIPSSVTNMEYTFGGCTNLTKAPVILNGVTNMEHTFIGCTSLTEAPAIPSSITSMYATFSGCASLTEAPVIPNSVTNMSYTFRGCTALEKSPVIPSSVTNMSYTFWDCTALEKAPAIPSSVTNMYGTFYNCTSLTEAPDMSQATGVTNMYYTFGNCTALTTAPVIPNNVINMEQTFWCCTNLTGDVEINTNPTSYDDCFSGTTKPIKIIGSCSYSTKSKLSRTANYGNATY